MKALIVEDEKMAQVLLCRTIETNFPDIEVVYAADSVRSAVDFLSAGQQPDIIFMDVELSDGDCFEIFRQVDVRSRVVMTTAYDQYAIKAFEAGSIDYLLKPISLDALKRAVGRCRERAAGVDAGALLAVAPKKYKETSTVRVGDNIIPMPASKIAYFFSEDKANYLTTMSGECFIIDSTLDQLEAELNPEDFFRISRGCIISRGAIDTATRILGGRLKVLAHPQPNFEMTVSRARVEDFLTWLG